ncbi:hypothetical protein niasHS_016425 [Heterodera schachtii]|uniref:Uncharacterized protein n=1 Tax=Heterodera schachtii TaxID=97005 RepID=A0ABD2HN36_HETSC
MTQRDDSNNNANGQPSFQFDQQIRQDPGLNAVFDFVREQGARHGIFNTPEEIVNVLQQIAQHRLNERRAGNN